ncbi:MAG: hypothetical protein ACHQEA_05950 [Gaiellales bacterium]
MPAPSPRATRRHRQHVRAGRGPARRLQTVAEWNPVSTLAAAVRTLFGNPTALPANPPWPLEHPVICSIAWCAVILAVVVPLTLWRYRSRTAG